MTITIGQLAATESLRSEIIAGHGGSGRSVGWAHVCELSEPWEWVGSSDLVLTTGIGIPTAAADQVEYVLSLDRVGVVGVVIGDRMNAPPLTSEMLAAANRASFPVLLTSYEIRFSRFSHIVAMANVNEHSERLTRSLRILERVSQLVTVTTEVLPRGFGDLADDLDCDLVLLDPRTWHVVPPTDSRLIPQDAIATIRRQMGGRMPERPWPTAVDGRSALVTPIPEPRQLLLVAIPRDEGRPDLLLLEQAATVISVEQAYLVAARERNRRLGSSALAHLIDQRYDAQLAADALGDADIGDLARLVALTHDDGSSALSDLHHALDDAEVDHMMLTRSGVLLLLLNGDDRSIELLTSVIPASTMAGISSVMDPRTGLTDAVREARSALRNATDETPIVWYEEADWRSRFLPRDVHDTRELARDVIGDLLDYDADHDGDLARTLLVFLEENRGWQRSADLLFIHRQTLVYRVKRIETLIDRDLRSTADVAEVWLAVQAAIECGLIT